MHSTFSATSPGHSSSIGAVANSASSAPGPRRPMQGTVHGFDPRTGMGKIKGTDGATYSFFSAGVTGGVELPVGAQVAFVESDGVASNIALSLVAAAASSHIGGLANSASAPVGTAQPMRGSVQQFDQQTGMGKIKGTDGMTYRFFAAGIVANHKLAQGRDVEFVGSDGVATKVAPTRRGLWSFLLWR
jgi:cold shock CspA family protein